MYFIYAAVGIVLIVIDFFVKLAVRTNMLLGSTIPVIENVFHITYVRNTGAAFSMFNDHPEILTVITCLLVALLIVTAIVMRPKKHLAMWAFTLMIAGGIGNIIDRFTLGYVVDFFDFRLINFAIFNTADTFVVIGAGLFILHTLLMPSGKEEKRENTTE